MCPVPRAENCAEAVLQVLDWYKIGTDIHASVNDTTTSGVATGYAFFARKDGDCVMPEMCNLVANSASGKYVRTLQRVVVDQFEEECEAFETENTIW